MNYDEAFLTYLKDILQKRNKKLDLQALMRKITADEANFFNAEEEELIFFCLDLYIWLQADTTELIVQGGKIHSFRDNNTFGDFSLTVILKNTFLQN